MKSKLVYRLLFSLILFPTAFVHSAEFIKLDAEASDSPFEVTFLETAPQIDGILDDDLKALEPSQFNYVIQFVPGEFQANLDYRLAYGTGFLYLFITLDTDEFIVRDRGYQNGDGFVLLFNATSASEQEENVRMLSFAPKGDTNGKLSFTWYENGKWMFRKFSNKTKFEVNRSGSRVNYELLLSWQDIYPVHPWLSEAIGFNINFSKAFGDTGLAIYANKAEVGAPEPGMSDHLPMNFEPPGLVKSGQTYLILDRNHLQQGEKLRLRSVTTATDNTEGRMAVTVAQAGGANLLEKSFTIQPPPGTNTFAMDASMLEPADYRLTWESFAGKSSGEIEFTVLPQFNEEQLASRLAKLSGKISYGSVATMEFNLESILQEKSELRASDNCPDLRQKMEGLFEDLESAESGYDPLAAKQGYVRRAFRSEIDGTLQPYTVRVPDNYDKATPYAAIVFLHGSDSDDTAVERHENYLVEGDVFVIAPNGRGPRTAYTVDHAQEDIGEAISDALENYNIDKDRLILAGYSMGGYGAYRTFYETPDRYTGVAVFSGHPSLAEEYFPGMGHPDFLQEAYLEEFSGSNFIIFHGRKDRNTQFELTDEFAEKLTNAGVDVKYFIDENVGHRPPRDKEILESYYQWLADTVK